MFSVVPSYRTGGDEHTLEHRWFLLNIRKHFEGDGALAQASQGGCGVSFLGDTQKPDTILGREGGPEDLQKSLQHQSL